MRGPCPAVPVVMTVNELVVRAGVEQLQLRVLVDRPERAERRRALAVLAEALGPELHEPAREALEPVGIRPSARRYSCPSLRPQC